MPCWSIPKLVKMITKGNFLHTFGISFLLLVNLTLTSPVIGETVTLQIKLDYPLLQQLMVNQLFKTTDNSAEVLHDSTGCNKILISDPRLGEQQQKLEITTHLKANIGTALLGTCTKLYNWQGVAEFLTEPVILPDSKSVRLNILKTRLYNQQGQLLSSGPLWDLADGHLQQLMSRYEVDLAPTIKQLNQLIPALLNRHTAQQISRITNSLELSAIETTADGIDLAISLEIDRLPTSSLPEAPLSVEELQQLESKWQMMDALITYVVKQYAATTNQQELHEVLLEILLDARYRLQEVLAMTASPADDPVRRWFIDTWQRLTPVIRQISLATPGQEPTLILTLLTATSALDTLDRLGPSIGLDISADGLRRLARILITQPDIDPLRYDERVDPELRRLLQLPTLPESIKPSGFHFNPWPISTAWAKTSGDRLNLWIPRKSELSQYLPMVRDLLIVNANNIAEDNRLDSSIALLYRHLVLSTAWQESCWRQYVVEKKKIVPLRSHTGDVGLMQMNERVWRGFYDIQKLRWDINYNARAGAEVLLRYLVKYALKKGEHKHSGGLDNLARATYSAYNGGPRQISRYRNSKARATHKKIDAAFFKKYRAVKQGQELHVAQCLGADISSMSVAASKPESNKSRIGTTNKQPTVSDKTTGKEWVLAQNTNNYTLQLAVFSSLEAANSFKNKNALRGVVAIAPLGKSKQGLYVVVTGSYKSKLEADRQRERYSNLKPWVRQFKDIHMSLE